MLAPVVLLLLSVFLAVGGDFGGVCFFGDAVFDGDFKDNVFSGDDGADGIEMAPLTSTAISRLGIELLAAGSTVLTVPFG